MSYLYTACVVNAEDITAIVLVILAVLLGLRRIIRALVLLAQESSRFLGEIVVFSKEGRVLRRELRKWKRTQRQKRVGGKGSAEAIESDRPTK